MSRINSIWIVSYKIVLFIMAWGIIYAPFILLYPKTTSESGTPPSPDVRLYFESTGVVAILIALWIMAKFIDRRPFKSFGFERKNSARDLGAGIILGSAMLALSLGALLLFGWADMLPFDQISWSILSVTALGILLNSITQEVLVRGYILQSIESRFGSKWAILISSIVFSVLHAGVFNEGGIFPPLNLFLAGILLALCYTVTRNLWLPISWHFIWNFALGPLLGIQVSGQDLGSGWHLMELDGPELFTGGNFGIEGSILATMTTALGIGLLIFVGRKSLFLQNISFNQQSK